MTDKYSNRTSGDGYKRTSGDGSKRTSGDDIWKRDEIQSPCVKICIIHPEARLCTGCLRTIDEITHWSRLGHEARADIMDALPARAPQLQKRRGGRAARLTRGT